MARSAGYREVRGKLSIFGWLWRLLLLGWQVLMIVWFITYTGKVAPMVEGNDAAAAGAAIGVGLFLDDDSVLLDWRDGHSGSVRAPDAADEGHGANRHGIIVTR